MDPAALFALFALPCAVAAFAAWIPSRADGPRESDRWSPVIERESPAIVPTIHAPRPLAARAQPAPVTPRAIEVAAPSAAPSAARSTAVPSPTSMPSPSLEGTLVSEEAWTWDEAAFREWWERRRAWYQAYWARQRWARIAPAMARMHALRAGLLDALQSSGAFDPSSFERMTDCGPFACGASSTYVPPVTPPSRGASSGPTVARRTGARWVLSNAHASLVIHADQSCRVDYSLTSRAPATMVFDTPRSDDSPVASCTVRERAFAGGAALELSWVSDRWTQQVVVALADDASLAEATIARTTVDANDVRTIELSNLSPSPRQWNIGGRDLSLDPGSMLRVRTAGEPDESPST